MSILLKNLLKEVEEASPLQVQLYLDMDGVLADMNTGFKKISGGYTAENFKEKFDGDKKIAQKHFWKLINNTPNFWLNLPPMPDAHVLWGFVKENFESPVPVVLSAGQGYNLVEQKTQWIRNHIDPKIRVIIADTGVNKPNYTLKYPPGQSVAHVLVDDTHKNVNAWNNESKHRIAIHHSDAGTSISQLKAFLPEVK